MTASESRCPAVPWYNLPQAITVESRKSGLAAVHRRRPTRRCDSYPSLRSGRPARPKGSTMSIDAATRALAALLLNKPTTREGAAAKDELFQTLRAEGHPATDLEAALFALKTAGAIESGEQVQVPVPGRLIEHSGRCFPDSAPQARTMRDSLYGHMAIAGSTGLVGAAKSTIPISNRASRRSRRTRVPPPPPATDNTGDPFIHELEAKVEAEARRREAEERVMEPMDRIRSLREQLRTKSFEDGKPGLVGLAQLIGAFMGATRAVGWGDRFERLKVERGTDPSWKLALEIYRRSDQGEFDDAAALMAECEERGKVDKAPERTWAWLVPLVGERASPNAIFAEESNPARGPSRCNGWPYPKVPPAPKPAVPDEATRGTAQELWGRDPPKTFETLRDRVCEATRMVCEIHRQALAAPPGANLASVGSGLHEPLRRARRRGPGDLVLHSHLRVSGPVRKAPSTSTAKAGRRSEEQAVLATTTWRSASQ